MVTKSNVTIKQRKESLCGSDRKKVPAEQPTKKVKQLSIVNTGGFKNILSLIHKTRYAPNFRVEDPKYEEFNELQGFSAIILLHKKVNKESRSWIHTPEAY